MLKCLPSSKYSRDQGGLPVRVHWWCRQHPGSWIRDFFCQPLSSPFARKIRNECFPCCPCLQGFRDGVMPGSQRPLVQVRDIRFVCGHQIFISVTVSTPKDEQPPPSSALLSYLTFVFCHSSPPCVLQPPPPAHVRQGQLALRVELTPPESKYVGGGGVFLDSVGKTITPGMGSGLVLPAKIRRVVGIGSVPFFRCFFGALGRK